MQPEITEHLPHRPPFLFVDEIVEVGDASLTARLRARSDFEFFKGHYPGDPIMPGVIVSEAVFQAGCALLSILTRRAAGAGGPALPSGAPVLARIENARFRSIVRPGDELTIEVKLKEQVGGFNFLTGSARVGTRRVMHVDFCVGVAPAEGVSAAGG